MRLSPILVGVPLHARTTHFANGTSDTTMIALNRAQPTGTMYTDPLLHEEMERFWSTVESIRTSNQGKERHERTPEPVWHDWFTSKSRP